MRISGAVILLVLNLSLIGSDRSFGPFYVVGALNSNEIAHDKEVTLYWKFNSLSFESYSKYEDHPFEVDLVTIIEDTLVHSVTQDSSFTFDPRMFSDVEGGYFILQVKCNGELIVSLGMRAEQLTPNIAVKDAFEEANWYLSNGMNLNAVSILSQENLTNQIESFRKNLNDLSLTPKYIGEVSSWRFIRGEPYLISDPPKIKNFQRRLLKEMDNVSLLKFRVWVNEECEILKFESLQNQRLNQQIISELEVSCKSPITEEYQFFITLIPNKKGTGWSELRENYMGRKL